MKVCQAAVGVVADLCRAFEADVIQYMDELMLLLHAILQVAYSFISSFSLTHEFYDLTA